MELILTNAGSYPRIGETSEQQTLRKAIAGWEKREKSEQELAAAEDSLTRMAIEEQIKAGLDLITDGQIRWYDPISHLAGKLAGVKINGLLRYFDTNFYFRQPVITDRLQRTRPMVVSEFEYARSVSSKPVKPVLTGPYSLACFSIVEQVEYKNFERRIQDYAAALAGEVKALVAAGAEIIQVDEPAILKNPADFDLFAAGLRALAEAKGGARLALYTYFGDAAPLYERFQELPVEVLGFDFTYSAGLLDRIVREGSAKALGLGLIDGRNTKLEDERSVLKALEILLPAIKADDSYLNPSCGLEYLPRDRAFLKLQNMAKIKAVISGQ
jgi:5-methyltetrahydropteroyltriglutamate--homocysteine methyltransferase